MGLPGEKESDPLNRGARSAGFDDVNVDFLSMSLVGSDLRCRALRLSVQLSYPLHANVMQILWISPSIQV